MNILGDFISRVRALYGGIDNDQLEQMLTTITNLGKELEVKEKEIQRLQTKLSKLDPDNEARQPEKKATAKKATAKKATAKKASAKAKEEAKPVEQETTQKSADPKAE